MDWMNRLDKQESKKWEDMMVSFAFDQEEWTDARTTLIDLLQKDPRMLMSLKECSIQCYHGEKIAEILD